MPGGLLNLIAVGQQNIILNGSPKKTFWKTSYSKYTNFGMQKLRPDFNGLRKLRLNDRSTFTFKYPRYGDLVMDTYLVVNLPHIWSPLYPIIDNSANDPENCNTYYIPYNFKWIEKTLITLLKKTNKGIAFNNLSSYVDYKDKILYYEIPEKIFNFCKTKLSPLVTIRHDYQIKNNKVPYEFTTYIYKTKIRVRRMKK